MSDRLQHIDIDSEESEDAPRALREYAKQLKRQLETTQAELGKATKQLASRAIAEVLADKGFKNPKRVERDLLADDIDPHDQQAVAAWLEANGDDYAKGAVTPASESPAPETTELAQQYDRLSVGSDSQTAAPNDLWARVQAEITPDMTGDQVIEVYKRHGLA